MCTIVNSMCKYTWFSFHHGQRTRHSMRFFFIYPGGKDVARWDRCLLPLTSPALQPRPAGSTLHCSWAPWKPMRARGQPSHLQPGWMEQILGSTGRNTVLQKRRKEGEKETECRTEDEEMEKKWKQYSETLSQKKTLQKTSVNTTVSEYAVQRVKWRILLTHIHIWNRSIVGLLVSTTGHYLYTWE